MATSLYDLCIPAYLQGLTAAERFLKKGADHGLDLDVVYETRLYDDMFPFAFQVWSIAHHSRGTVEALKSGLFRPPGKITAPDYAGLQQTLAEAREAVAAVTPDEINAREGADVIFQLGENKLPFTAEGFVSSFSLPNFYFHAATAYDILRMKGVPLGKRDFMGALRMKV